AVAFVHRNAFQAAVQGAQRVRLALGITHGLLLFKDWERCPVGPCRRFLHYPGPQAMSESGPTKVACDELGALRSSLAEIRCEPGRLHRDGLRSCANHANPRTHSP